MNLLFYSFIYWSSVVHFKNGLEYLTRGQPKSLSHWWEFYYAVWFRVVFSFSWGILFFFFHLHSFNGVRFQYFQVFVSFIFYGCFDFFSWFDSSIPSDICCFLLFIKSMAYFLCRILPLYHQYITSQLVLGLPIPWSLLANSLILSMYIRWSMYFLRFMKCVSFCAFPMYAIDWHHLYYK